MRLADLGALAPDEPLNMELRYVYVANELRRDIGGEPSSVVVHRARARPADLPACAAPR